MTPTHPTNVHSHCHLASFLASYVVTSVTHTHSLIFHTLECAPLHHTLPTHTHTQRRWRTFLCLNTRPSHEKHPTTTMTSVVGCKTQNEREYEWLHWYSSKLNAQIAVWVVKDNHTCLSEYIVSIKPRHNHSPQVLVRGCIRTRELVDCRTHCSIGNAAPTVFASMSDFILLIQMINYLYSLNGVSRHTDVLKVKMCRLL